MSKVIKTKSIIGIIVALIIGLLTVFDIVSVINNPNDYLNVYQISENSTHWMFRSISNYELWDVLKINICLIYIALSIVILKRKPLLLIRVILIFELLILVWFIRYFFLFYASDFDHYPSFDPYIF